MADNTTTLSGVSVATDEIGGTHHQRMKVQHGADGSAVDASRSNPLPVVLVPESSTLVRQFLDTNGDGTGTTNANGDYSSTADQFYIEPASGTTYKITELLVHVEDGSGFTGTTYGAVSTLTNGVGIEKQDNAGATLAALDGGLTVKQNADWGRISSSVEYRKWTSGNEVTDACISFDPPLELVGIDNDRLTVVVNDDLTGLVSHTFLAVGLSTPTV